MSFQSPETFIQLQTTNILDEILELSSTVLRCLGKSIKGTKTIAKTFNVTLVVQL